MPGVGYGNEYIDFRNGLGPVTLGYCVPEIDEAVKEQLEKGIVFGHPHPLEGEVAESLVEIIPCAERVRFLKTGGEAIAACIKIARNATGRNKILQCGYNDWLNCLSSEGYQPVGIASAQPDKGVPFALGALHRQLAWGKIEVWERAFSKEGKDIAAVVIASDYPRMEKGKEFLPAVRKLTEKYGSLMIMDEIVTGDSMEFKSLLKKADTLSLPVCIYCRLFDERIHPHFARVEPVDLSGLKNIIANFSHLPLIICNCNLADLSRIEQILKEYQNIYMEISHLESLGVVRKLIDNIGIERILFGTYAPYFYIESSFLKIKESRFSEDETEMVFSQNAERLIL